MEPLIECSAWRKNEGKRRKRFTSVFYFVSSSKKKAASLDGANKFARYATLPSFLLFSSVSYCPTIKCSHKVSLWNKQVAELLAIIKNVMFSYTTLKVIPFGLGAVSKFGEQVAQAVGNKPLSLLLLLLLFRYHSFRKWKWGQFERLQLKVTESAPEHANDDDEAGFEFELKNKRAS